MEYSLWNFDDLSTLTVKLRFLQIPYHWLLTKSRRMKLMVCYDKDDYIKSKLILLKLLKKKMHFAWSMD